MVQYLRSKQCADGAWVDCEDTAWCTYVLRCLDDATDTHERSTAWLAAERSGDGWGYCRRDAPCIPITSTVRLLVPSLSDNRSEAWLREECTKDLSGPFRLSYKAAWYLLAGGTGEEAVEAGECALRHLVSDQRKSGGWGPWRDHPAPTDCFSTGIAMWAIASRPGYDRIDEALDRAIAWCESHRLHDGLFPTHFIEEGSAWIHLGWSAALKRLGRETETDRSSCVAS